MSELGKAYSGLYWRLFNFLGRIVGVGFVLGGAIFTLWGIFLVVDRKATVAVNRAPSSVPWVKAIALIGGVVVFVPGVLLLKARRFRPDLGDSPFTRPEKRPIEKGEFP